MDKLLIEGGTLLSGQVRISGAKNAALPILAGTLLTSEPVTIRNVPHLKDVTTMLSLLQMMGAEVTVDDRLGVDLRGRGRDRLPAGADPAAAAGALIVQEAGGMVSDIRGGSKHLESGNVIVAGLRLHRELVAAIRPHVPDDLRC
mgnify:CR=1 FL=1